MPFPALVIFDCDGVLVDSETVSNTVLAAKITKEGWPLDVAASKKHFVGGTMTQVLHRVEKEIGRKLPSDWLDSLQEEVFSAFRNSLQPVSGVGDVIDRIAALEIPHCVASQGKPEKMELTLGLTGLRDRFGKNDLFSATMVPRGKPFPDLFLFAASAMGVEPTDAVVIEDSPTGVKAAVAAGMRVFGYAAETDPVALRNAGAETFSNMAELPALMGLDGV